MKTTLKSVSTYTGSGLKIENESRNFKIVYDEPPTLGGTDTGMNPMEGVLCALGSCQAIVACAFAKAFGIEFDDISVECEGDFDPDGFLGINPEKRNGYDEIRVRLNIKTNESEERVKEFAAFIESKCPVGDCLANGVKIVKADPIVRK